LEVLLAVAILSSAIVFIFRSFTSSLASVRFSQNITHACLVAERILWETHDRYKGGGPVQLEQGRCTIEEKNFDWVSEVTLPTPENLQQLKLRIWWPEKAREKPYQVEFETWLWKEQS
jgi:type II secretory pathway pseudopilin PulG